MKYINYKKLIVFFALAMIVFASCKKVKYPDAVGDGGQTLIKVAHGGLTTAPGEQAVAIDFVNTAAVVAVADIRRDPANEKDLNQPVTVTVKDDTAAVGTAGYLHMDPTWYSVVTGNGVTKAGGQAGTYTVTFAPGEFSKEIKITIPNATLLDPSELYGLGFTVLTSTFGNVSVASKTVITTIGAKNIYDGVYSVVSGFVQRYTGPGSTNPLCCDGLTGPLGPANADIPLITTGANSNVFGGNAVSAVGVSWSNNTGVGGIDGLRLSVDPVTNLVTMQSSGLPLSNATLTNWAGHPNYYDPATKTFYLAFRWNPAAATREYEVVLRYKGPR
ncbi:MAG TPA: hypothetical protein VK489_03410 [Ferruginibacter sp.]|nr:hypothetical protein [Ferruginibacter sp.]